MIFRAFWPVVDETLTMRDLIAAAKPDLPRLAAQAHAQLRGPGRWAIEPSVYTPGSGRVTDVILTYNAPAAPAVRHATNSPEVLA